jgi:hypothetical protein
MRRPEDPRKTPFVPILLYVMGFMAVLALLAYLLAWALHRR